MNYLDMLKKAGVNPTDEIDEACFFCKLDTNNKNITFVLNGASDSKILELLVRIDTNKVLDEVKRNLLKQMLRVDDIPEYYDLSKFMQFMLDEKNKHQAERSNADEKEDTDNGGK